MSKKTEKKEAPVQESAEAEVPEVLEEQAEAAEPAGPETQPEAPGPEAEQEPPPEQPNPLQEKLDQLEDRFLRLAAEYDNYRRRTAKEKESLWAAAKADTIQALLPVYDNLERALKQTCADEAYKKGVEMTMNQLKEVFARLGVTEIAALGEAFDPNLHNAVAHIDSEDLGENTVSAVFQAGFMLGDKVIRFAMVQVAN